MDSSSASQREPFRVGEDAYVPLTGLVGEVIQTGVRGRWVQLKMHHSGLEMWYHSEELQHYKDLLDKFWKV